MLEKNAEFNKILIEANIALENQRTRLIQLKNMNKARFKTACDKGFEQILFLVWRIMLQGYLKG